MSITAMTHVGLARARNEDTVVLPGLMSVGSMAGPWSASVEPGPTAVVAVLDGMGGHRGGQEAGRIAGRYVLEHPLPEDGGEADVAALVTGANACLYHAMREAATLTGMGATVAGVAVTRAGSWAFNVGDARVYQVTDGYLVRVSVDDLGGRPGAVSQCLGGADRPTAVEPHIVPVQLPPAGGAVLVCSDGLSGPVTFSDVQAAMLGPASAVAPALLRLVWAAGAPDNVSFVVLRSVP